jgi:hypothetical protein
MVAVLFRIKAGTRCRVRKKGETDWRDYRTTKGLAFATHGVTANGGLWTFEQGGWELAVSPRLVKGRGPQPAPPQQQYTTFNKSILGRNGRGANRRRNMRAAKRRK